VSRFRVQGIGCRVEDCSNLCKFLGKGVVLPRVVNLIQGLGLWGWGWGVELRVGGLGVRFRDHGLGCRV